MKDEVQNLLNKSNDLMLMINSLDDKPKPLQLVEIIQQAHAIGNDTVVVLVAVNKLND